MYLGKFQIQGTDAIKPMSLLSGGQKVESFDVSLHSYFSKTDIATTTSKSRVAFAALAFRKPHVLIIDEGRHRLLMISL